MNPNLAKRKLRFENVKNEAINIVFEPWLTSITLEPKDGVIIEFFCRDLENKKDLTPILWLGKNEISIHTNCMDDEVRAWKNGV